MNFQFGLLRFSHIFILVGKMISERGILSISKQNIHNLFNSLAKIDESESEFKSKISEILLSVSKFIGGKYSFFIYNETEKKIHEIAFVGMKDNPKFEKKLLFPRIIKITSISAYLQWLVETSNPFSITSKYDIYPSVIADCNSVKTFPFNLQTRQIGYLNFFYNKELVSLSEIVFVEKLFSSIIINIIKNSDFFTAKEKSWSPQLFENSLLADFNLSRLFRRAYHTCKKITSSMNGYVCSVENKSGRFVLEECEKVNWRGNLPEVESSLLNRIIEDNLQITTITKSELNELENKSKSRAEVNYLLYCPLYLTTNLPKLKRNSKTLKKPLGIIVLEKGEKFTISDISLIEEYLTFESITIEKIITLEESIVVNKWKQKILEEENWDIIFSNLIEAIKAISKCDYINVFLVRQAMNTIQTEYLYGIEDALSREFKSLSSYSLLDNTIYSEIIKSKQIKILENNKLTGDEKKFRRFKINEMKHIFFPLEIPSTRQVIGIVDIGFAINKQNKLIFEYDLQILDDFIKCAAKAIDSKNKWLIEKIGHEFRNSIVAIRNNSSNLQRNLSNYGKNEISKKCDDLLIESENLLTLIGNLENVLGKPKKEQYKDEQVSIIKELQRTQRQIIPLLPEQCNADNINIEYDKFITIPEIWIDRSRFGQVLRNLFLNSINYSKKDPSTFSIYIDLEESPDDWVIIVQDWGIGIKPKYAEKIFEEGFRTPEAIARNVTGSGFGLSNSRIILNYYGGDIVLARFSDPTEFQLIIPKQLHNRQRKGIYNDFIH